MLLTDFVSECRDKLNVNANDPACLLFALQIPSICARIKFQRTEENTSQTTRNSCGKYYKPNGGVWDENIYKAWVREYIDYFYSVRGCSVSIDKFCDIIYDLRCQMTHEGIITKKESNNFYFIKSNSAMSVGNNIFIPIDWLCESMFNAVEDDHIYCIDITPFKNIYLQPNVYSRIRADMEAEYHLFWDNRTDEDNMLNCIYKNIIFDNSEMIESIEKSFEDNPNTVFEIWDVGYKFGIIGVGGLFVREDYDEQKSSICREMKIKTDVLSITKSQYDRMLEIVADLEEFSNNHPFDITQYVK